jgi:DNA-binding transcriptional MerR regulator
MMTYALMRPLVLSLETYSRLTGVHPDLIRQLVSLDLVQASLDLGGDLWFDPSQIAVMARIRRLRSGFSLNYSALALVIDLLDRIAELEEQRRPERSRTGGLSWT